MEVRGSVAPYYDSGGCLLNQIFDTFFREPRWSITPNQAPVRPNQPVLREKGAFFPGTHWNVKVPIHPLLLRLN